MAGRVLQTDNILLQLALEVRQRGWSGPALALLEAAQPLALLGGQLLWLAQPFLGVFLPGDRVGRLAQALEEPEAMIAFMAQLEDGQGL
jgi:hypothetical protein